MLAEYDYSGKPVQPHEDLAVYAGNLANFVVADPTQATALVDRKILPAYRQANPDSADGPAGWGDLNNYYTQNWVWFGLALYSRNLPNLSPAGS